MVDFVPLEAFSGPRPTDPDLARFHVTVQHGILNTSLYVCNNMTLGPHVNSCLSLDNSTDASEKTIKFNNSMLILCYTYNDFEGYANVHFTKPVVLQRHPNIRILHDMQLLTWHYAYAIARRLYQLRICANRLNTQRKRPTQH